MVRDSGKSFFKVQTYNISQITSIHMLILKELESSLDFSLWYSFVVQHNKDNAVV